MFDKLLNLFQVIKVFGTGKFQCAWDFKSPCGKSLECCLGPVTQQLILPDCRRNKEQTADIFLGMCPNIVESAFVTATANQSSLLVGSLLRDNSSPTTAAHVSLYSWYPHITDGTVKGITLSAWRRSNAARVRVVACSSQLLNCVKHT